MTASNRPADLTCIGNFTIDEVVRPDGTRRTALGGDALFAVLAARLVGGHADWLAPLGDDNDAELLDLLRGRDLDVDRMPRRDLPTVRNIVTYLDESDRHWLLVHGEDHFDRMSVYPEDVPAEVLAGRGVLVLAMSLQSQLVLTPWLRAATTGTVFLDLQEDYILGHEAELLALVGSCDVLLPSEVEAQRLTGTTDTAEAARRLLACGAGLVVVTLAERGCLVAEPGRQVHVPAEPVVPVDSTGAGDAFAGAFAAAHLAGLDPVTAATTAARVAAVAISGYGTEALLDAQPLLGGTR